MTTRTLTLAELAAELPRMIDFARFDRDYLIIVDHGPHYVQLAFPDGWILGEAVSNEYLADYAEPSEQLTEPQEVLLDILGWERPHAVDRDGHSHRNFHRAWHGDTPSDDIARDALNTLVGVYLRDENTLVEVSMFGRGRQEDGSPYEGFGDGDEEDCDQSAVTPHA
jgi:hypothetical protein